MKKKKNRKTAISFENSKININFKKTNIMSSGKVVLGAIAGLATGAILGILFAPEKGKDTRKKIAKKSKDSMDEMKAKYEGVIDTLSNKYESIKKDNSQLFSKANDLASEAKDDASKLYSEGKDLIHDAKIRAENQIK
jgi:gas vesicle protein